MSNSLFVRAAACLDACSPDEKVALSHETARQWREGQLSLQSDSPPQIIAEPGRPSRPHLVAPRDLPRRRLGSPEGHAALIHAICHIEFNAINLAWDAVYRFRDLPSAFYDGWVQVAEEEAYHFTLLQNHLTTLGYQYGDFDAHNGLWEMAQKTAHDPLVRMALVPRVLEARGLDVTPGIMDKLTEIGDQAAVDILKIVFRDEVGHVAIGSRWFHYLCEQQGIEAEACFQQLLEEYMQGQVKGPFQHEARRQGGFTEQELAYLEGQG